MDDTTVISILTKQNMMLLIFTCALVVTVRFLAALYHQRFRQYARFPQLPAKFLWGHLKAMDGFYRKRELDRHPGKSITTPKRMVC